MVGVAAVLQVRRQLHAYGTALLRARQAALLPGLLRLAGPLAADPALQLLRVGLPHVTRHSSHLAD